MKSIYFTHMEGACVNDEYEDEDLYSSEEEEEIRALTAPLETKCPCGLSGIGPHRIVGILGKVGSISCRACKFEYPSGALSAFGTLR